MNKKKKPNPIEKAIGERAKPKMEAKDMLRAPKQEEPKFLIPLDNSHPSEVPDEPTPQEMLNLEDLNRQTEERLLNQHYNNLLPPEKPTIPQKIPVSKPDLPPVTKNSSPESQPPQKGKVDFEDSQSVGATDESYAVGRESSSCDVTVEGPKPTPAEDKEFIALKEYIFDNGFVVSTTAFHIVTLCAQPMVTPATTNWDFVDRAKIPDMVFALLKQPGYLESIWPSLRIVMGSNKGNAAWCSAIAMTIAFFDTIRVLPVIEELKELQTDL